MHTHVTKDGGWLECEGDEDKLHWNWLSRLSEAFVAYSPEYYRANCSSVYYPPLPDGRPDPRDGWAEVERLRAGIREAAKLSRSGQRERWNRLLEKPDA